MLRNYLKIAWRNIRRNKSYAAINILGLTIGMASAILIFLWIDSELNYDRFYAKSDRIYIMFNRDKFDGQVRSWNSTPKIMAPTLEHDYPEVEAASRFNNITFLATVGEKKINSRGAFTDNSFLSTMDYPVAEGQAAGALVRNDQIVLTEKMARKFFGNGTAVGKTILIDSNANFTVSAVLKDIPENSVFSFDYLLPWSFMDKLGWNDQFWGNNSVRTVALLKSGTNPVAFNEKVKNITRKHSDETTEVFAYPLSRLHLYGKDVNGQLTDGQIVTVRLFGLIGVFILLIACINFMNLSTARSEKRAREVGVRKVAGANRSSLILQFIGESVLLSGLAFLLAILIVQVSLGRFNELVGKTLVLQYGNPWYWLAGLLFVLFTGLLAGSYPAFYLSSFTPTSVLKGRFKKVNALVTPRKIMVVTQFSFAIVLIVCTVIVKQQIQFAQDRDTGYNRNKLIYVFTQGDADKHYLSIKNDLLKSGAIESITRSANPITQRWSDGWGYMWDGSTESDKKIDFVRLGSDADMVKTIGLTLKSGRDIDIFNYPGDTTAVVLNETAVKLMRLKDPIGQNIHREGESPLHIVGVVKDFILESPFEQKINPMLIVGPSGGFFQVIHMKLSSANGTKESLSKIEKIFQQYNPQYPLEYAFADDSYARKFKSEQRTGVLAGLFAGLSIFISCLGLFGLATYMAESRVKEIGVRKVMGASVLNITALLSGDFIKLVTISILVASPLAFWLMTRWLENYSYHKQIEWWVFVAAGLLSVIIALATISYQAIRAALANPVQSLRSE
ncbi:MAG: ABC transporter permease [Bacteroidota bacterium]|nr:ABC transporter permease [Bacteroidota bacterium]